MSKNEAHLDIREASSIPSSFTMNVIQRRKSVEFPSLESLKEKLPKVEYAVAGEQFINTEPSIPKEHRKSTVVQQVRRPILLGVRQEDNVNITPDSEDEILGFIESIKQHTGRFPGSAGNTAVRVELKECRDYKVIPEQTAKNNIQPLSNMNTEKKHRRTISTMAPQSMRRSSLKHEDESENNPTERQQWQLQETGDPAKKEFQCRSNFTFEDGAIVSTKTRLSGRRSSLPVAKRKDDAKNVITGHRKWGSNYDRMPSAKESILAPSCKPHTHLKTASITAHQSTGLSNQLVLGLQDNSGNVVGHLDSRSHTNGNQTAKIDSESPSGIATLRGKTVRLIAPQPKRRASLHGLEQKAYFNTSQASVPVNTEVLEFDMKVLQPKGYGTVTRPEATEEDPRSSPIFLQKRRNTVSTMIHEPTGRFNFHRLGWKDEFNPTEVSVDSNIENREFELKELELKDYSTATSHRTIKNSFETPPFLVKERRKTVSNMAHLPTGGVILHGLEWKNESETTEGSLQGNSGNRDVELMEWRYDTVTGKHTRKNSKSSHISTKERRKSISIMTRQQNRLHEFAGKHHINNADDGITAAKIERYLFNLKRQADNATFITTLAVDPAEDDFGFDFEDWLSKNTTTVAEDLKVQSERLEKLEEFFIAGEGAEENKERLEGVRRKWMTGKNVNEGGRKE